MSMLKLQKKKPDGLKIIVVGCGKVGSTLVEQLSREGHDLTIIDESAAIVEPLHHL
jgi:trk system potassium uptake protein TrkA